MPEACEQCGQPCRKTAGGYQRLCTDCQEPADDYTPHVTQCDKTDCEVCHDYLKEMQKWIHLLYLRTVNRKRRQQNENARLDQSKDD